MGHSPSPACGEPSAGTQACVFDFELFRIFAGRFKGLFKQLTVIQEKEKGRLSFFNLQSYYLQQDIADIR